MKNSTECPNCKSENDYFSLNCSNCGSLIRERVVNLDLWYTIGKIIESPSRAFTNIIRSENKNYTLILAILFALKLTLNSFFFKSLFGKGIDYQNFLGINILIGLGAFFFLFLIISSLVKFVLKLNQINTRFKDNFSSLIYTSIPLLISLFILFPVEYAIFGRYWLFFNPSPFTIKTVPAFVFAGMELVIFIWSAFLYFMLGFVQSKSKAYSIAFMVGLIILFGLYSIFIPNL